MVVVVYLTNIRNNVYGDEMSGEYTSGKLFYELTELGRDLAPANGQKKLFGQNGNRQNGHDGRQARDFSSLVLSASDRVIVETFSIRLLIEDLKSEDPYRSEFLAYYLNAPDASWSALVGWMQHLDPDLGKKLGDDLYDAATGLWREFKHTKADEGYAIQQVAELFGLVPRLVRMEMMGLNTETIDCDSPGFSIIRTLTHRVTEVLRERKLAGGVFAGGVVAHLVELSGSEIGAWRQMMEGIQALPGEKTNGLYTLHWETRKGALPEHLQAWATEVSDRGGESLVQAQRWLFASDLAVAQQLILDHALPVTAASYAEGCTRAMMSWSWRMVPDYFDQLSEALMAEEVGALLKLFASGHIKTEADIETPYPQAGYGLGRVPDELVPPQQMTGRFVWSRTAFLLKYENGQPDLETILAESMDMVDMAFLAEEEHVGELVDMAQEVLEQNLDVIGLAEKYLQNLTDSLLMEIVRGGDKADIASDLLAFQSLDERVLAVLALVSLERIQWRGARLADNLDLRLACGGEREGIARLVWGLEQEMLEEWLLAMEKSGLDVDIDQYREYRDSALGMILSHFSRNEGDMAGAFKQAMEQTREDRLFLAYISFEWRDASWLTYLVDHSQDFDQLYDSVRWTSGAGTLLQEIALLQYVKDHPDEAAALAARRPDSNTKVDLANNPVVIGELRSVSLQAFTREWKEIFSVVEKVRAYRESGKPFEPANTIDQDIWNALQVFLEVQDFAPDDEDDRDQIANEPDYLRYSRGKKEIQKLIIPVFIPAVFVGTFYIVYLLIHLSDKSLNNTSAWAKLYNFVFMNQMP